MKMYKRLSAPPDSPQGALPMAAATPCYRLALHTGHSLLPLGKSWLLTVIFLRWLAVWIGVQSVKAYHCNKSPKASLETTQDHITPEYVYGKLSITIHLIAKLYLRGQTVEILICMLVSLLSTLALLFGWKEEHLVCKKCCHSSLLRHGRGMATAP